MKYLLLVLLAVCMNFGLNSSMFAAEESTPAVTETAEKACPADCKKECCVKADAKKCGADCAKACCKADAKKCCTKGADGAKKECCAKKADAAPKKACCAAKKDTATGISAEGAKTPVSVGEK